MIRLSRIAGRALPWLIVIAAALACCDVAARWPGARPRPDAAMPIPGLSEELLGPSVDEAIEQFNRRGPEWASPPEVVE
jgi:hypothetical protein